MPRAHERVCAAILWLAVHVASAYAHERCPPPSSARSNLLSFSQSNKVDKKKFLEEVTAVRNRLRNISRRTINPRSRFVRMWDLVMVAALISTTFITPFEVAFFEGNNIYNGPINFTINRLGEARGIALRDDGTMRPPHLARSPSRHDHRTRDAS